MTILQYLGRQTSPKPTNVSGTKLGTGRGFFGPGFVRFFRELYPQGGSKYLARTIDRSPSTTKKWLLQNQKPDADSMCLMIEAYGFDFLVALMPHLDWLREAALNDRKRRLLKEIERIS